MTNQPTIREICEEFRRLDKEATPAPWDNEGHTWLYAKVPNGRPNGEGIATFLYEPTFGLTRTKSTVNAELAQHVRNHFPALVAEVERLQGENEKEPQPDSVCVESDGCPTENAVLKREWRRLQKRVEELEEDKAIVDWLEENCWSLVGHTDWWHLRFKAFDQLNADTIRDAVKAARAQKGEQ